MLASVKPLLQEIVGKILPEAARDTLGLRVAEQLKALARERSATGRWRFRWPPKNRAVVDGLAEQDFGFPVRVQSDDTLSDGQVFLRFGEEETEIEPGRGDGWHPRRPWPGSLRGTGKDGTPWMTAPRPPSRGNPFTVVPIEITISVGKARPLIRDLLKLTRDSVLPLDRRVEDPVELYVGDRLIARGELEEMEGDNAGQLAVRLTEVSDLSGEL